MFIDFIENGFTTSFDSWSPVRKTVFNLLESQVDIGSAQNNNSPNYLIVAHQTEKRIGTPKEQGMSQFLIILMLEFTMVILMV